MNRRGFALLVTMWALIAASVATAIAVRESRMAVRRAINRIESSRAGFSRDACLALLTAAFAEDSTVRNVDSTDVGRGTWCRATMWDPATRVNVNVADSALLARVFQSDMIVA